MSSFSWNNCHWLLRKSSSTCNFRCSVISIFIVYFPDLPANWSLLSGSDSQYQGAIDNIFDLVQSNRMLVVDSTNSLILRGILDTYTNLRLVITISRNIAFGPDKSTSTCNDHSWLMTHRRNLSETCHIFCTKPSPCTYLGIQDTQSHVFQCTCSTGDCTELILWLRPPSWGRNKKIHEIQCFRQ